MATNVAYKTDETWPTLPPFQAAAGSIGAGPATVQTLTTHGGHAIKITGTATRMPEVLEATICKILSLDQLDSGWNSYGAKRVEMPAIRGAISFVLENCFNVCTYPEVAPNTNGGVELVWAEGRRELEIGTRPDALFDALFVDGDVVYEPEAPISAAKAAELVKRFRSGI